MLCYVQFCGGLNFLIQLDLITIAFQIYFQLLAPIFGANEFIASKGFLKLLISDICAEDMGPILCKNALFAIFGFSNDEIDSRMVPLLMVHLPAGSSTRQLIHFAQEIESGNIFFLSVKY